MGDGWQPVQVEHLAGWETCGSDMVFAPGRFAATVLPPENGSVRANMFVYLFRRFGYPIHGWDGAKGLVSYYLTTPDRDVVLECNPGGSWFTSFGYGLRQPYAEDAFLEVQAWRERRRWSPAEREQLACYQRIAMALQATLQELLRPVRIRDTMFNILGMVSYDSGWPGAALEPAERSRQAGYGLGDFDPFVAYSGDD